VYPLIERENDLNNSEVIQPLMVRDEIIGELSIDSPESSQEEANELISAVAAQLSAHVENLRLSQQTEQALATTQKQAQREQALRQITSAVRGSTDPATIMRTAVRELGNILGRKTAIRMTTAEKAETAAVHEDISDSPASSSPISAVGGNE
jgi:GAF domain-containing protein